MIKIWKEAAKFWKVNPSDEQYKVWSQDMQRYDYAIISQGFEILKREKRFFPTPNEWRAVVDSIDDIKHDKEFERVNRDAKDFWAKPSNDWKPLIRLLKKEITRGEFLQEMKAKGVNVLELTSYYEKSGLPLNLKAGSQNIKDRIPEK
ncbi:MAG: hypothetical protein AABY15_03840, partial [Nanoarchaeota archaeon]